MFTEQTVFNRAELYVILFELYQFKFGFRFFRDTLYNKKYFIQHLSTLIAFFSKMNILFSYIQETEKALVFSKYFC